MDAAKGVVSYALAAQLAADDLVLSAVLSDELSTIKAGATLKVDKDTTAAAEVCLLYTSPSPRDGLLSRMPSSA